MRARKLNITTIIDNEFEDSGVYLEEPPAWSVLKAAWSSLGFSWMQLLASWWHLGTSQDRLGGVFKL